MAQPLIGVRRAYTDGMPRLAFAAVLLLVVGCAMKGPQPPTERHPYRSEDTGISGNPDVDERKYAMVRVFYGTDRKDTGAKDFGAERGETSFGSCDVSIPHDHRYGALEQHSVWKFQFYDSPAKHVMVMDGQPLDWQSWVAAVDGRIAETRERSALVFVHGYNVSFRDAARRVAQMAYDLQFDGVPMLFSWPSHDGAVAYFDDEKESEWAQPHVEEFLRRVRDETKADSIYVVAHSMGGRPVARGLADLAATPAARRFKELVLAAPDIDAGVFSRDIAPWLPKAAEGVTLYCSSSDLALGLSKRLHDYRRAGDSEGGVLCCPGIESIDASAVDTGLVGHSYYAEELSLIGDLFYLLHDGFRADRRFALQAVGDPPARTWRFRAR
jgi:esterase/lipase superfamily enzyme